jgi:hypothetical protein
MAKKKKGNIQTNQKGAPQQHLTPTLAALCVCVFSKLIWLLLVIGPDGANAAIDIYSCSE